MKNIKYFFRRKFWQIKRVLKWIPVIWKQYDFDYSYSLEVFKLKLGEIADHLESDRAKTMGSKQNALRIRTAIELMDRVNSDYYLNHYIDKAYMKYGERGFTDVNRIEDEDLPDELKGEKHYEVELVWLRQMSEDEIKEADEYYDKMVSVGMGKQKKAHKLLWKFIEHNIERWWD